MDLSRYLGQLSLPEIGVAGQKTLSQASVLCVGTGGLGSPAALYLAAAGVGRLGLVDSDVVEASNLHRQILFKTCDIGKTKVQVARKALSDLNPDVELVIHEQRLDVQGAAQVLAGYDVIVDGTDNFPARYLINDTCVQLGKPDVWAAVYRLEGQLSVFDARRGPCYRCLFPEIPSSEQIPSCAEAGVIGVLPGVLGTMQALEALKLVLGIGEPLIGRLLAFDGLALAWSELALPKDPDCPACGRGPKQAAAPERKKEPVPTAIAPQALRVRLQEPDPPVVIDCREPFEWEIGHLEGSRLHPLRELATSAPELERDANIVVVCHHGPRSMQAAAILQLAGFRQVSFLEGGLDAWARQIDPQMSRY